MRHQLHHISITPKERYIKLEYFERRPEGKVIFQKERYRVASGFDMQDLCYTLKAMTKAIKRTPRALYISLSE